MLISVLVLAWILDGCLFAQETAVAPSTAFLFHPEAVLALSTDLSPGSMTLAPKFSEKVLPDKWKVVMDQQNGPCRYASAVCVDDTGQVTRQRGVLAVGSDYVVIVDYFYEGQARQLERSFTFPSGPVHVEGATAYSMDASGHGLLVQANEPAEWTVTDNTTHLVSNPTPPTRLATLLLAWKDGPRPKVETIKPALPLIVKFRISFANGRVDDVALAWEARALHIAGTEFHGWAACSLRDSAGEHSWEIK
jgi:hypothetical protein